MQDFQFYVTDDRYGVRSLVLVQTRDEIAARPLASRLLTNKHYHGVEVWCEERKLFALNEPALEVNTELPPKGQARHAERGMIGFSK